jgi:hypothetical protein
MSIVGCGTLNYARSRLTARPIDWTSQVCGSSGCRKSRRVMLSGFLRGTSRCSNANGVVPSVTTSRITKQTIGQCQAGKRSEKLPLPTT